MSPCEIGHTSHKSLLKQVCVLGLTRLSHQLRLQLAWICSGLWTRRMNAFLAFEWFGAANNWTSQVFFSQGRPTWTPDTVMRAPSKFLATSFKVAASSRGPLGRNVGKGLSLLIHLAGHAMYTITYREGRRQRPRRSNGELKGWHGDRWSWLRVLVHNVLWKSYFYYLCNQKISRKFY